MITLYAPYNFPPILQGIVRDIRVLWALEETGLPYQISWFDSSKGEHRTAEYRRMNPFGKIPAMTDGDMPLFETGAMVNYVFDKAGRNPATIEGRARNLAWCFAALNTVEVQTFDIFLYDTFWKERPNRDQFRAERVAQARLRMNEMETALGDKPYLTGSELAPADILMATVAQFARNAPEIFDDAPKAAAWLSRCTARPAFARASTLQGKGPDGS